MSDSQKTDLIQTLAIQLKLKLKLNTTPLLTVVGVKYDVI